MKKLIIAATLLFSCTLFAGEVTFKDTSKEHLQELKDFIKKELRQRQQEVNQVQIKSITYTSPAMEKVFGPHSFYSHFTIDGKKTGGMVLFRNASGIKMIPAKGKRSPDLIIPQHFEDNFRLKTEIEAGFLHKALYHFYGRGDPQLTPERKAIKKGDTWILTDTTEFSEMGFLVKVNGEGKVLEVSQHLIMK